MLLRACGCVAWRKLTSVEVRGVDTTRFGSGLRSVQVILFFVVIIKQFALLIQFVLTIRSIERFLNQHENQTSQKPAVRQFTPTPATKAVSATKTSTISGRQRPYQPHWPASKPAVSAVIRRTSTGSVARASRMQGRSSRPWVRWTAIASTNCLSRVL